MQVVLFGQPELDRRLAKPSVRQLRQRIAFSRAARADERARDRRIRRAPDARRGVHRRDRVQRQGGARARLGHRRGSAAGERHREQEPDAGVRPGRASGRGWRRVGSRARHRRHERETDFRDAGLGRHRRCSERLAASVWTWRPIRHSGDTHECRQPSAQGPGHARPRIGERAGHGAARRGGRRGRERGAAGTTSFADDRRGLGDRRDARHPALLARAVRRIAERVRGRRRRVRRDGRRRGRNESGSAGHARVRRSLVRWRLVRRLVGQRPVQGCPVRRVAASDRADGAQVEAPGSRCERCGNVRSRCAGQGPVRAADEIEERSPDRARTAVDARGHCVDRASARGNPSRRGSRTGEARRRGARCERFAHRRRNVGAGNGQGRGCHEQCAVVVGPGNRGRRDRRRTGSASTRRAGIRCACIRARSHRAGCTGASGGRGRRSRRHVERGCVDCFRRERGELEQRCAARRGPVRRRAAPHGERGAGRAPVTPVAADESCRHGLSRGSRALQCR